MLRKFIALLLTMSVCIGMTIAFAWNCPSCGNEMDSKFCGECGSKRPENNSYTDPLSGASFILPPNWVERALPKEAPDLSTVLPNSVVFMPRNSDYQCLIYSYLDVWGAMDQTTRKFFETAGVKRSNFTSSFFADENIAQSFNCNVEDISREKFGSREFILLSIVEPHMENGVIADVLSHYAICYENGYAYVFVLGNWLRTVEANDSLISLLESFTTSVPATASESRIEFVSESQELTMFLPHGWLVQSNADLSGTCLFAKNMKSMDPSIQLVTTDLWGALSEETRSWYQAIGLDRTIMETRYMNAEFVAKIYGKTIDEVQQWEGDHVSFYLYWDVTEATVQGKTTMVDCLCAYTIQNGYSYDFMLFDPSYSEENMDAYLDLLRSVKVPRTESNKSTLHETSNQY